MKVNELLAQCQEAVANGYGEADILFDTEAACFNVHLVDVDNCYLEPDMCSDPVLLLTTKEHYPVCECRRVRPDSSDNLRGQEVASQSELVRIDAHRLVQQGHVFQALVDTWGLHTAHELVAALADVQGRVTEAKTHRMAIL